MCFNRFVLVTKKAKKSTFSTQNFGVITLASMEISTHYTQVGIMNMNSNYIILDDASDSFSQKSMVLYGGKKTKHFNLF